MCGRARCNLRSQDIPMACHLNDDVSIRQIDIDRYRPSYNVSPGTCIPVVYWDDGEGNGNTAALHCMKWGLIPSFTKKDEKPDHYKMFNARCESISEKASFRRLIPKNRCLVAVEGFYEWKKDGNKKLPYHIHFKDGRPLVFAALYDSWRSPEGEIIYTFTIITTSSSKALQWLHDRMPVILGDKASTALWLNGSSSKPDSLLKPYEHSDLAWYPVTPEMGKPSFDSPECIKEIPLKTESRPITNFFSKKGTTDNAKEPKHPGESALKEPLNMDPKVQLKGESEAQPPVETESQPVTASPNDEVKPNFDGQSCPAKRELKESQSDTKPTKLGTAQCEARSCGFAYGGIAERLVPTYQRTMASVAYHYECPCPPPSDPPTTTTTRPPSSGEPEPNCCRLLPTHLKVAGEVHTLHNSIMDSEGSGLLPTSGARKEHFNKANKIPQA